MKEKRIKDLKIDEERDKNENVNIKKEREILLKELEEELSSFDTEETPIGACTPSAPRHAF